MASSSKRTKKMAVLARLAQAEFTEESEREMLGLVDWFIENGYDDELNAVIDNPGISDEAADALEVFRDDLGYREAWNTSAGDVCAMPFALLVEFALGPGAVLPSDVPLTRDSLSSGLLRRLTGVGSQPTLLVFESLLRPEISLWTSPSRVRRMLARAGKTIFERAPMPAVPPEPVDDRTCDDGEVIVCIRVLVGIAFTVDADDAEKKLFGTGEEEPALLDRSACGELESILKSEIDCLEVTLAPYVVELHEVPSEAAWLIEMLKFEVAVSDAIERLLGGKPGAVATVIHTGMHECGDNSMELRIAAYDGGSPVLRHSLDPAVFDLEDSVELVGEVAARLGGVRVVAHEGITADACATCGTKLWPGGKCH